MEVSQAQIEIASIFTISLIVLAYFGSSVRFKSDKLDYIGTSGKYLEGLSYIICLILVTGLFLSSTEISKLTISNKIFFSLVVLVFLTKGKVRE